jgi:catechol-2,3-dioxygenase
LHVYFGHVPISIDFYRRHFGLQELGRIYRGLCREGIPVHAVDHRISWALYCADPDGNGLEVYWDTRRTAHGAEHWQGIERPLDTGLLDHPE